MNAQHSQWLRHRNRGRGLFVMGPRPTRIGRLSAVTAALIGIMLAAGAAHGEPMEVERLGLWERMISAAEPPASAYPVALSLVEFEEHLPVEVLRDALTRQSLGARHPLVRAYLRWRLAEVMVRTGEFVAGQAELDGLGFLTRWHLLGPFPNEGMSGFLEPFEPEVGIDVAVPLDGLFAALRWQAFETRGRGGYVRLSSVIAPTHDAVTYLATVVESPVAQEAVLWLTVDGAYRAWLGTELIAEQLDDLGGPIDREGFRIKLAAGPNQLLVKVANAEGYAGLYARLTTTALEPLPLPHGQQAPSREVPVAATGAEGPAVPSVLDTLLEHVETLASDASSGRQRAWAAYALHRLVPGDVARPGEAMMQQALAEAGHEPDIVWLAVEVFEEPWRQREAVERALVEFPDNPWVIALRARQLLDGAPYDRNAELATLIERLAVEQPESAIAALLQVDWLTGDGLLEAAYARLVGFVQQRQEVPSLLEAMQARAGALERFDAQADYLERLIGVHQELESHREVLADLAMKRGDGERAIALLDEALAVRPDAYMTALHKAELLTSLGRTQEAREVFLGAIAGTPTAASLREAYGNWLLAHGGRDEALDAFRAALAFEAQNESLRSMVRYLDPDGGSFEQPYLVEAPFDAPLPSPSDDYVALVEQKIVQLHDNGLTSTYYQKVYKIFTDEGVSALRTHPIYYSPDDELLEIDRVRVVKPDGSTREVFDRRDYSVADESVRMYYDRRQAAISVPDLDIEDQLELRYRLSEITQASYFDRHFGDVWFIQDVVPRAFVRYVLIAPTGLEVRFRLPADGETPVERQARDGSTAYVVTRRDVPKVEAERQMPGFSEIADYLQVSTFADWSGVARWYWNLARDQWVVDPEMRRVVQELVAGVEDRRERVRRVHNYVVKNTRYVALEFGVHGYKPYRTTVCFRRRFGDCKDKASLIKVMLEEAEVPADIVLVRTRRNGVIATEPATLSIFDHAIAYVPEFDLFLDGTAEFSGTSELPAMDQGVTVLIVKNGGEHELRMTPVAAASENAVTNTFVFELDGDTARLSGEGTALGQFAPGFRQRYESREKRRDLFEEEMAREYPGVAIEALEFDGVEDLEKPVSFRFEAAITNPLKADGEGFLLYPHAHTTQLAKRLAPSAERQHDLTLPFPFEFRNELRYELPANLEFDQLPAAQTVTSAFGEMSLQVTATRGGLEVHSSFRVDAQQIAAAAYPEFQAFVLKADRILNTPLRLRPR